MNLFFHKHSLQLLIFRTIRNLWPIWVMFIYVFFCNIIKVNHFLYSFIMLLHLISSFSLTRSSLVPYAYVSVESNDCIPLSSFELNAALLISSVKSLWISLLNLCCVFYINLLFLMMIFSIFFAKSPYFLSKIVPLLKAIVWELCYRFFSSVFSFCKINGWY